MVTASTRGIEIFYSYAHEDQAFLDELEKHLSNLKWQHLITSWSAGEINPGQDRDSEIKEHLDKARIILLLVSPDYMNSDYLYNVEMKLAMDKVDTGEACVIPIILRPVDWKGAPFSKLAPLPNRSKPVTSWSNRDEAFSKIVEGIRKAVLEVDRKLTAATIQSEDETYAPSSVEPEKIDSGIRGGNGTNKIPQSSQQGTLASPSIEQGEREQGSVLEDAIVKEVIAEHVIRDFPIDKTLRHFDVYAQALAAFIASPDTSTPLNIGIDGPAESGKTSMMRMVQHQLDPPLNFGSWLWSTQIWLKWFISFLITLPVWMFGKLLGRFEERDSGRRQKWFPEIRATLAFDPGTDLDVDLRKSSRHRPFWAKIAAWHCPLPPLTHPTIWFNAWQFDQVEQLWVALALVVMDQLKRRYHYFGRVIFWVRLVLKRSPLPAPVWIFLRKLALPLILGLFAWQYDVYIRQISKSILHTFSSLLSFGTPLLAAGALLILLLQVINIVKDPFDVPVKDFLDKKTNDKEKVDFLGSFATEFSSIVSIATEPSVGWKARKMAIFIDNLDRCEPHKSLDVLKGINLFLDSGGCVFVLGLDFPSLVASIDAKHQNALGMKRETPGLVPSGRSFLDMLLQMTLPFPSPTESAIEKLVDAITEHKASSVPSRTQLSPDGRGITASTQEESLATPPFENETYNDAASYIREDIREAIREGARLIAENNPRQVKQFVNLFRLNVYMTHKYAMLAVNRSGQEEIRLNLKRLAIWVVCSIRWAEISKFLSDEAQPWVSDFRDYLLMIAKLIEDGGSWVPLERAVDLYPTYFGNWHISPDPKRKQFSDPVYEGLVRIPSQAQKARKKSRSDWHFLPWQEWLRDPDFLECVKQLEFFWQQSPKSTG